VSPALHPNPPPHTTHTTHTPGHCPFPPAPHAQIPSPHPLHFAQVPPPRLPVPRSFVVGRSPVLTTAPVYLRLMRSPLSPPPPAKTTCAPALLADMFSRATARLRVPPPPPLYSLVGVWGALLHRPLCHYSRPAHHLSRISHLSHRARPNCPPTPPNPVSLPTPAPLASACLIRQK